MASASKSFSTGTGDGGKLTAQEEKLSRDATAVFWGFLVLSVLGLVFVTFDQWGPTAYAAILWSMACLAIGSLVGFLFGIPRVLQAEAVASPNGEQAAASTYTLKVNTNLEVFEPDAEFRQLVGLS